MKLNLICLCLFIWGASAIAQETSVSSAASVTSERLLSWDRLSIFLGGYPVPILSEGLGIAAEYTLSDHLSLWGDATRAVVGSSGDTFYNLSEGAKVTDTSKMLGLRGYLSGTDQSGLYVGAGLKSVDIDINAHPGILAGPAANKADRKDGAFAALGYRLRGRSTGRVVWLVDLGVHYGPGQVSNVRYVTDTPGLLGAQTAHVEGDSHDGLFPEARVGVRF